MVYNPELQSRVTNFRAKAAEGSLTEADMLEIVSLLRDGRRSAAVASEGAKTKAKKTAGPALNGDDLLGELML